jgi:hypothetical protein
MRALSMLCSELVVRSKRSSIILACLAACCASGLRLNAQILTRGDLQNETAEYEAASRRAEPPHMPAVEAGRIWLHLGVLYQHAGRYSQSEITYEHAMRLLTICSPVGSQQKLCAKFQLNFNRKSLDRLKCMVRLSLCADGNWVGNESA